MGLLIMRCSRQNDSVDMIKACSSVENAETGAVRSLAKFLKNYHPRNSVK